MTGRLVFLLIGIAFPVILCGQFGKQETISYSTRMDSYDPVRVSIDESESGVVKFVATNDTYYPFTLTVRFKRLENFTSLQGTRQAIVSAGKNNLFDLRVKYRERDYGYQYEFSYILGSPKIEPEMEFPYLIPIKPGTTPVAGEAGGRKISDSFAIEKGDTVFCSRRGKVTATPGEKGGRFRISGVGSLEVLHDDGTLMIYNNLSGPVPGIKSGMIVYPGDPVAIASENFTLMLHLIALGASEQLQTLPILYSAGDTTGVQYSLIEGRVSVTHPESIITREMSPKEIKQRQKKSGQSR